MLEEHAGMLCHMDLYNFFEHYGNNLHIDSHPWLLQLDQIKLLAGCHQQLVGASTSIVHGYMGTSIMQTY